MSAEASPIQEKEENPEAGTPYTAAVPAVEEARGRERLHNRVQTVGMEPEGPKRETETQGREPPPAPAMHSRTPIRRLHLAANGGEHTWARTPA